MSARQVGIAPYRLAEHPRAAEIDATARWVLTVMAMFVGSGERHAEDPVCFAAHAAIAERAGCGVTTVQRAQKRLHELGLIEHAGRVGQGLKCTTRWRMPLLTARPSLVGRSDREGAQPRGSVDLTDKHSARSTDKHSVRSTDNPSDSSRPPGSEERGRSDAADAAPLPGGRGSAAAPSTVGDPGAGVLGEIATALGCTTTAAEAWAQRKLNGASGPVRNETAFLRTCLLREVEQRNDPPRPAKGTTAKGSAKGTTAKKRAPAGAAPRPHYRVRVRDVDEAVKASRGGESHDQLAERLNVTVDAVDACRREHDRADGFFAALAGEAPDQVAARFPWGWSATELPERLQMRREKDRRVAAVRALRRGEPAEQVAGQAGVDVDTVLTWRRNEDRSDALRRSLDRAA